MASGGSRQRKTRWDDSRGRQQDEPTLPAPPPPPEPGGGESTLSSTDCGREPNDSRGAADTREQQDENRKSLDQHVHAPASHELWGQKEENKTSQESWGQQGDNAPHDPWGQQGENKTPHDPWGQQGENKTPHDLWGQPQQGENRVSQEPWSQQNENMPPHENCGQQEENMTSQEPWVQQVENRASQEPWVQQGENRTSQEPWVQPGEARPPQEPWMPPGVEPWAPPGVGRGVAEAWAPPGVGGGPTEPWVTAGLGSGVVEAWAPPAASGAAEPWAPPAVGRGTAEPWLLPGVGRGVVENWLPPGVARGAAETWVAPGVGRGAVETWVPPGVGRGAAEPWVPPGVGRGTADPWFPPGVGRGAAEPWGPPAMGRGAIEQWAPPGVGRGAAEPWVPPGMGRGAAAPWPPPGMGRGATDIWVPPGVGRGAADPSMQHPDSNAPGHPGQANVSQQPWGQHGENRAFHEQQGWPSQEPWSQHGDNLAIQEQHGWASQEHWGHEEENKWRASQDSWGQQWRGRGSREPWGKQWEGRDHGSQKQWKQQGDGRERGSHGPWGNQVDGRGRRSRAPWGHQGEGRDRGSRAPWGQRGDRGDNRGRGSHVPWGHHGEGRGRGSRAPWGQQNRGSQDSWRQQGEPRDRGSQKPWGHPGENRDGHAHEQWVQQWDGRERGSRDSWGQQERGSQDNWKRQGEGGEGGPATPWGQQGEDKGKGTTEQWGHQTDSGEGGGGVPREQPTEVSEREIPGPWGQPGGERVFPEHIMQPEANGQAQTQEPMGFHGVAIEEATEETLRQQVCGRAGLKDPESQQQDVPVHELQERERSQKESIEVLSQEPGVQRHDDAEKKLDDLAWKQIEVRQSGSQERVELQDGMGGLFQMTMPYQMEGTEMVSGELVKLDEEMRTKGLEESVGQVDTKDLSVENEKVKSGGSEETVWEQKNSERISTEPMCQHDDVRKKELVEPIEHHEQEHHEQDSDKGSEMPTGQEGSGREIFLEEPVNPYEQCGGSGSTAPKGQPGESVEEPVPQVEGYRESGSEVPMDQHGVDQDVLSKESTELHKMLSECASHGPVGQQVVNRETSSIEPVGWHAMDRDMRSTEPAEQHDTFRERGSDVPLGQQGVSSETVSIEPVGWQGMHATFRERGSEVPVGDQGVSRETVSIEPVGWQGVDRDMRSTEPAEEHEAFKESGSDVPLGQEGVSRGIVSNEPVGWQGMERDMRSTEPAEQYEASWERGLDVPVEQQGVDTAGHSHEQLLQNVCRGSEFKQPLVQHEEGRKNESAEPLEKYKENKGQSLADHSMQHEKDLAVLSLELMAKQKEDKEGLSWEGQKMFSEETVGSDVKDVSLETVVQQVEGLKYSEEGDKQPEECNLWTISTSTGPHEEIKQWDKSKKAVSEELFVEAIIPSIKEKVEDGEAGTRAETQRLMTKAQELTGTSKEKLHSNKERREKQDDEVNVRELKAKECSTATELITEHNIQEHRGTQRERKHRSRDKGRAEEEVCGIRVKEISALKEEQYGAGDEMKHRVDDHRERRRSIKEVEKTFVEDVDCGGGTKEIRVEEGGEYDVKAEMKHRRQKGHEETREAHKERKHSKRESEQSFGDGDDGRRIKDMALDEEEEYGARTEMKHRRQRSHEEERGSYGEKRRRGRERERTFEEEECGEGMNPWDCRKNDEGAGEDAMGQWSGVIEETRELEDDRKTSEIKRLSSKRKERKREKEEDGGRERKHKGKERREKHEGEASGEKKHGSSRKKRKREKSWEEEEEEEEEEDDGITERKHRSRDRRREKHRVGEEDCGEGDMMHWGEGKREEGDMDREQWGYSREVGVLDEGADMTGEMMYWSGRDREHHDGDMTEFEWKHMHSRKERKRVQGEDEAGSGRKHSGGRDKHRKREEDDGGEDGVGDMKSSRKRDRKREHEDDMGGERKHRSSRKKQRRREEEECRGSVSKQWSDSEKERLKEGLLDLEEENCEGGKPHGDSREKMNEEDDGGGLELKHGRSRPMDTNKEEDEVENYLSVLEQERNRATAEVLHQAETTQESGREKEMKREKPLYETDKDVGESKHDALQEKENHKDDVAQSRHGVYMEIERNYMQAADGEEKLYHDGDKERERTGLSAEGRRHIRHSRESRREKLVTENVFEVAHTLNSEEINVTAHGNIRGDVKHATGLEQRSYHPEEIVGVVEHAPEMDLKGIGGAERKHELESKERRTPLDGEDQDGKGHEFLGGEMKHGHGMDRKEELEDEGEQLMDAPGREESNSIHMKATGRDEMYAPESNEGKYALIDEVEHASGIEGTLESIDVDGGGDTKFETVLEQNVSGEQHQEVDGPDIKEVEGLRKPWLSPSIEEGGGSANPETEKRRDQLLSPSPMKDNVSVADGEKKMELLLPLSSFSHDGSIRERERRRELLLKSLASFKEGDAGSGDGERDRSLLVPPLPSKENSGGSGVIELEKIELLSTPPAKQVLSVGGRVRKKDLLFLPPSKEESVVGKEKERLPSPPPPKEADGEERWVGPLPTEASQTKKRKVLEFERVYLDNLPSATMYERSYMHRDVITHVACTKTDFIITASHDGHVKFWKKVAEGIEFVKHFRSHLGVVECIAVSSEGALFCSVGDDQAMKVFDVVNFDMINMLKLGYCPGQCEWLFCPGDAISAVASSEKSTGKIFVYDGRGSNKPMHVFERLHSSPLTHIRLNPIYKVVVSADKTGMIEYWTGPPQEYNFPKNVHWEYKTDTDLYEFAKCKTYLTSLCFSPDGKKMATIGSDRKVRIFRFLTGKLMRVFDESLSMFTELQQMRQQLPDMEFGRRMAVERELEKVDAIKLINIIFDETGHFVLYGTMLGIKVINVETNRCVRILGKQENVRMLQIAMFQGVARKHRAAATIEMKASDNPVLMSIQADPTIVCTAFKKNRFYLFSKREPEDTKSADSDRDVFNEKPSKEEVMAATQAEGPKRVSDSAIVHTSMGDVHVKLFPVECPKTVENFCVHSRNGYYNGHTFHRIIKGFMVQTGDPSGTGMGGESIWGGEFEDEFHSTLRHDRPYTISMANAGPNSNGSQFFLTVVPTPWLDNKHTVFGRVTKGMEVVQRISNVKVNPKTDKPYEDISIISITVK